MSRFNLRLLVDNEEDTCMYTIIDDDGVFKNFYCLNPSDEELENYRYLCECLNSFDKDLNTAWELMESVNRDDIGLKQRITNVLLEEIKDCDAHKSGRSDEFVEGRMYEIKVLLEELTDK